MDDASLEAEPVEAEPPAEELKEKEEQAQATVVLSRDLSVLPASEWEGQIEVEVTGVGGNVVYSR